jgi:hypothetical protein
MNCLKCGFDAGDSPECPACGVIFDRIRAPRISRGDDTEHSDGGKLLRSALVMAVVLAAFAVLGNKFAVRPELVVILALAAAGIPRVTKALRRFSRSNHARTKKLLFGVAAGCLTAGVVGYLSWGVVLGIGPGAGGEHWTAWNTAIDVIWVVIPVVLAVGFVAAVASVSIKPRSGPAHVAAFIVIAATVVVVAWIAFVVTHLDVG